MKMNEASRFMRDISRAPEENLSRAILSGKFPNRPLSEKERILLRRRIADIDEKLQEALEALADAESERDRVFKTMAPRNRSESKLPWNVREKLEQASTLAKSLENERSILEKKIKESLLAEQIQRQELGEKKAAEFTAKARKFIETISEKPDTADLVVELAKALNEKNLEQAFMPFLKAKSVMEDLATERRYVLEAYSIEVDELPKAPNLDYVPDLQAALSKLLGKKLQIPRSRIWQRVWAEQRASDRDAAAKRLGIT